MAAGVGIQRPCIEILRSMKRIGICNQLTDLITMMRPIRVKKSNMSSLISTRASLGVLNIIKGRGSVVDCSRGSAMSGGVEF